LYSGDFDRPWIRDEITSDREEKRYSQQQLPIVAAGGGLWRPEYKRRVKAEVEKRNGGIVVEGCRCGLSLRKCRE